MDFSRFPYYCGASLAAFVELARRKRYRLVGCERAGVNAISVRADLGNDQLPAVQVGECLEHWTEGDWSDRVWVDVSSSESEILDSPLTGGQKSEKSVEPLQRIPEDRQAQKYQETMRRLQMLEDKHAETPGLVKQFSADSLKREHALTALESAVESLRLENEYKDQRLQKLEERIECDKSKLGEIDDRARRALDPRPPKMARLGMHGCG